MKRNTLSTLFLLACFQFIASCPVVAQTDLFVKGAGKLFPIALPKLCVETDGADEYSKDIPRVIGRDLDLSGYFEVLNQNTYIESPGKCDPSTFAYTDWSVIGAEGLVRGAVKVRNGNITAQLYLHDVQRRVVRLGKEYTASTLETSRIAHRFANEIMKYFTGKEGVFGTSIAFSSRVGRFKELFVMDMDGSNLRQISNEKGLAISSSWAPNGQELVYTSYRQRTPNLFFIEPFDRRTRQFTRTDALELGGKYSTRNDLILASRTEGKRSDVVLLDRAGKVVRNVTRGTGTINVSPDWSPNEDKIVFCSNRSGGPQIYTMDKNGQQVKRISFARSNYCTSPSWSPTGDKIAFVCRADRGFQLFVTDPDGKNSQQLTSVGTNEDPDWSPDGRYIVFSTTFGRGRVYNLALIRVDGSNLRQLTYSKSGDTEPTWGPVIN